MNDLLEKYDILSAPKSGNFGSVYKAYNKIVDRIEAVKVIADVDDHLNKDVVEARLLHKLKHENITYIYDAFIRNKKLYILMEFLDGGTIEKLIEDNIRISTKNAIKYSMDILHGLEFIHNKNHIHRDVKPSNILLDSIGVAKLSDFGLVSELDEDGEYKSCFGYMAHKAPEVLKGRGYCIQSDIFAFGLTLYRMLNGSDFILGKSNAEICSEILCGKFPPRNIYYADVPNKLRTIINKCLQVDIDKRYQNASEIRRDLSKLYIPIHWVIKSNDENNEIWEGQSKRTKFKVGIELKKGKWDIIVKKGTGLMRKDNNLSALSLDIKEKDKLVRKLLTTNL